jgi:hypothetical protein
MGIRNDEVLLCGFVTLCKKSEVVTDACLKVIHALCGALSVAALKG